MGIWMNGIMGVVTGDALGCPVEFSDRTEMDASPVKGMEGYGTFNLPEGSWTDDSSMTLAALDSIREKKTLDLDDIMRRFALWLQKGEYTPFGRPFDVGGGCSQAITNYLRNPEAGSAWGADDEWNNGNGSLMRILPVCLYCYSEEKAGRMSEEEAVRTIHLASGLTHNHLRAKMACGLYFFMVREILDGEGNLTDRMQKGLDNGFAFYEKDLENRVQLSYFGRLRNLEEFRKTPREEIRSSGYVIDSIESAVWCLITTDSLKEELLKAVNLGEDTDTVAAIAGGLAGLYYGYDGIPEDWRKVIQRRDWIEGMCREMDQRG